MKETALGLGVILLFAGMITLPISLQNNRKTENEPVAERQQLVHPDWTISAQFNESERFVVSFTPPAKEGVPDGEEVQRYMYVDIEDPIGGNTTFNITFTEKAFSRVVHHNDGGLLVEDPQNTPFGSIGGTTRYTGEYKVRVYTIPGLAIYYYKNSSTMPLLFINKLFDRIDYPNIAALPVAASLLAVGSVLIVWGARSRRRRVKPRRPR